MISPRQSRQWFALFLFVQLLAGFGSAGAQSSKGTVVGRVVDAAGGVLKGARIQLLPGDITGASDEKGEFTINGVDAGTYTVTISYVGLETQSSPLEVKAGGTVRADAALKVGAQSESVIVTAERAAGEAEAVNIE